MSLFALAADHIQCWCPRLEVSTGSCSNLSLRSLLSHLRHQRLQFPPLNRNGSYSLFLLPVHLHRPGPCILGGWPLCVERVPFAHRLHPMILSDTFGGAPLGIDVKKRFTDFIIFIKARFLTFSLFFGPFLFYSGDFSFYP